MQHIMPLRPKEGLPDRVELEIPRQALNFSLIEKIPSGMSRQQATGIAKQAVCLAEGGQAIKKNHSPPPASQSSGRPAASSVSFGQASLHSSIKELVLVSYALNKKGG